MQKQKQMKKQQWLRIRLRCLETGRNISQDNRSSWVRFRFVEVSDIDFIEWTWRFDDKSRMSQRMSSLADNKWWYVEIDVDQISSLYCWRKILEFVKIQKYEYLSDLAIISPLERGKLWKIDRTNVFNADSSNTWNSQWSFLLPCDRWEDVWVWTH
jgi:hypothetical protein